MRDGSFVSRESGGGQVFRAVEVGDTPLYSR